MTERPQKTYRKYKKSVQKLLEVGFVNVWVDWGGHRAKVYSEVDRGSRGEGGGGGGGPDPSFFGPQNKTVEKTYTQR